jgi:hypothetical protein
LAKYLSEKAKIWVQLAKTMKIRKMAQKRNLFFETSLQILVCSI